MTAAELWGSWRLWMVVAAAIIVVAATLLITIWLTARGILKEAVRALRAAEKIRDQTAPVWALAATNEVGAELLATVQSIEQKGIALAEALEAHAGTR